MAFFVEPSPRGDAACRLRGRIGRSRTTTPRRRPNAVNVTSSLSLGDLVDRGAADLAQYLGRERAPASPLEWLGVAVTRLPGLTANARTADDVAGRPRARGAGIRGRLLDALARELRGAGGIIGAAPGGLAGGPPRFGGGRTWARGDAGAL